MPGLTEPLASRAVAPPKVDRQPPFAMGFGVGGVAVEGRIINEELKAVKGLKLPWEWLGETGVIDVGCKTVEIFDWLKLRWGGWIGCGLRGLRNCIGGVIGPICDIIDMWFKGALR